MQLRRFGSIVSVVALVTGLTIGVASVAQASTWSPNTTQDLINAINQANSGSFTAPYSINLSGTYLLTTVDNSTNGPTGLPVITSPITFNGNGATIQRVSASPAFRILDVAAGGGAILNDVTISGGSSPSGGGGILNNGTLTLAGSTVANNTATDWGGGIYNNGNMKMSDTTISSNVTSGSNLTGGGGGIVNYGSMQLWSSTVSDNTTQGRGGGIYSLYQTAGLINSTISGNQALNGGGIFSLGTTKLSNVTVTLNNATDQGGGVWQNLGTTTLKNTIVTDNTPSDVMGTTTNLGNNLFAGAALGPLASNGGPTLTHLPAAGSPAIDAVSDCTDVFGAVVTVDQGGTTRPQGALCDIGAVEVAAATAPPVIAPTCPTVAYDPANPNHVLYGATQNTLVVNGLMYLDLGGVTSGQTVFWDSTFSPDPNNSNLPSIGVKIIGSSFADVIDGTDGDDQIWGMNGNDWICGKKGADQIWGGNGNDRIWGNQGKDNLYGDNGNDRIKGNSAKDKLYGGNGKDRLKGGGNNDTMWGNTPTGSADTLDGFADQMQGGDGDDTYYGADCKLGSATAANSDSAQEISGPAPAGGTDTAHYAFNDSAPASWLENSLPPICA